MHPSISEQKHILVVDNDLANAEVFRDFLSKNNFKVSMASNAEAAFNKILSDKPDLAILDLFLPDLNAIMLCSKIRRHSAVNSLPVVIWTSHQIRHKAKMAAFDAGADDFLVKPFEFDELAARISAILRRIKKNDNTELLAEIQSVIQNPSTRKPVYVTPQAPDEEKLEKNETPVQFSFEDDETDISMNPEDDPSLLRFLKRFHNIIFSPRKALSVDHAANDLFYAGLMVFLPPIIGSAAILTGGGLVFNEWISNLSVGLATSAMSWVGISGLLNLLLPFIGINQSTKDTMTVAGLSSAPYLVAGCVSAFYAFFSKYIIGIDANSFSAGLNLIPGMPVLTGITSLSRIGLFDFWCVFIILNFTWANAAKKFPRWNLITIIIGLFCLITGIFTSY